MVSLRCRLGSWSVCFLFLLASWCHFAQARGSPHVNPYNVLGVSKDATNEEIRRNYKKLCLKYHPDKNVNKSKKERERCEEMFKRVQKANSEIGDEESRRRHDSMSSQPLFGTSGPNHPSSAMSMDDLFRAFTGGYPPGGKRSYNYRRTPFYVNGIDISQLFQRNSFGGPFSNGNTVFQSTYVEKVKVPLQDLYTGKVETDFCLHDSIWKRYRACFRGGVAGPVALQALVMCFPLMFRVRLPILVLCFGIMFHVSLPKPTIFNYKTRLQKGWKGGTQLKFKGVDPGFEIVFVLQEGRHKQFKRVGNNLKTTITIDKTQAKEGCTIKLSTMDELEDPITLVLGPNQIKKSGHVVTVKGKGWPARKQQRGDLLVTINLRRNTIRKKENIELYYLVIDK